MGATAPVAMAKIGRYALAALPPVTESDTGRTGANDEQ
jgi:hypothetical protein